MGSQTRLHAAKACAKKKKGKVGVSKYPSMNRAPHLCRLRKSACWQAGRLGPEMCIITLTSKAPAAKESNL